MKSALKPAVLKPVLKSVTVPAGYGDVRGAIVVLLNSARQAAARNVNSLMTASYWEIGRRIVEAEQKGKRRAGYGEQLIERLSLDLTQQFGRGFSADNLEKMRRFYSAYPVEEIFETLSRISIKKGVLKISETLSRKFGLHDLAEVFPLPWSAYMRLVALKDNYATEFYETEALRGGWSVRQLDRQIGSQFYERTESRRVSWRPLMAKVKINAEIKAFADAVLASIQQAKRTEGRRHQGQPGEGAAYG